VAQAAEASALAKMHSPLDCIGGELLEAFGTSLEPVPQTVAACDASPHADELCASRIKEISALRDKGVFRAVKRPPAPVRVLKGRWVVVRKPDGTFKSRFVAQGFSQVYGKEFVHTFAPTSAAGTWRFALAHAAALDYEIVKADISTAFLNADLEEEIYIEQPPGHEDGSGDVWLLLKALYGLRQAARQWHMRLRREMFKIGYAPSSADPATFIRVDPAGLEPVRFMSSHVDDLTCGSQGFAIRKDLKQLLSILSGTYEEDPSCIMGIQIERDRTRRTLSIWQPRLIQETLDRFGVPAAAADHVPISKVPISSTKLPPLSTSEVTWFHSGVGTLQYISHQTRPDICLSVALLGRHAQNPQREHLEMLQGILRYLNATKDLRLVFGGLRGRRFVGVAPATSAAPVHVYSDADYAGDTSDYKSTMGMAATFEHTPTHWASTKMPVTVKSTAASEFVAASVAGDTAVVCGKLLVDFGYSGHLVPLLVDNQATTAILVNPMEKNATKYLATHWHFVRELVSLGIIKIYWLPTKSNVADIFTKPLGRQLFLRLRDMLSLSGSR
jgi:hypothetical protein